MYKITYDIYDLLNDRFCLSIFTFNILNFKSLFHFKRKKSKNKIKNEILFRIYLRVFFKHGFFNKLF